MSIICGNALSVLKSLPENSLDCCVTSPPYYNLRDYGTKDQIGLEKTPDEYIRKLTEIFSEVRRVLKSDGTLWLNISDSYGGSSKGKGATPRGKQKTNAGSILNENLQGSFKGGGIKSKDMIGIPWMLAFSLRNSGWYLRSDIIWHKPNAMPNPVKDRPGSSYEHIFLFSKSQKYYFNYKSLEEPVAESTRIRANYPVRTEKYSVDCFGQKPQAINAPRDNTVSRETRRGRDVWSIATNCARNIHYAAFPEKLAEKCILAGCPENGTVLDPFAGSGTTGLSAVKNGREYVLIDINPRYCDLAAERINALK